MSISEPQTSPVTKLTQNIEPRSSPAPPRGLKPSRGGRRGRRSNLNEEATARGRQIKKASPETSKEEEEEEDAEEDQESENEEEGKESEGSETPASTLKISRGSTRSRGRGRWARGRGSGRRGKRR